MHPFSIRILTALLEYHPLSTCVDSKLAWYLIHYLMYYSPLLGGSSINANTYQ